jgi:hypothetical protein
MIRPTAEPSSFPGRALRRLLTALGAILTGRLGSPPHLKRNRRLVAPLGALLTLIQVGSVAGQTPAPSTPTKYPGLDFVHPVVVTRGTTVTVDVGAIGEVSTAREVLLEAPGVRGKVLPPAKGQPTSRARVELTVDGNTSSGVRELRLAHKDWLSTPAWLLVSELPVALEDKANDSRDKAQPVTAPTMIAGQVEKPVDVDWYRLEGRKGQRLNLALHGARLHDTMHKIGRFINHFDATLALLDSSGREIAVNNDFYFADPFLSAVLPADGVYFIRVQEARFKGAPGYTYALAVTTGPFASHAFPPVVEPTARRGSFKLLGPGLESDSSPRDFSLDFAGQRVTQLPIGGLTAAGIRIAAAPPLTATGPLPPGFVTTVPGSIAGTLSKPGQADLIGFDARRGEVFRLEVTARRIHSSLDSRLEILEKPDGRPIATNDDSSTYAGVQTKDSVLIFTAPRDGRFLIRVSDLMARGGPTAIYHLRVERDGPDFDLTCDPALVMLGPGNRSPIYVRMHPRGGFLGPVRCRIGGLPAGVSAGELVLGDGRADGVIIVETAADAKPGAAFLQLSGSADLRGARVTRVATPLTEVYQAQRRPARTLAAAITEASDVKVRVEHAGPIALPPGGSVTIPVRLERNPRYANGTVNLQADWRFEGRVFGTSLPPGVTIDPAKSKLALNGADTEGRITLKAAPDAKPTGPAPFTVIATVPIEFSVAVPFCSPGIPLRVTRPGEPVVANSRP